MRTALLGTTPTAGPTLQINQGRSGDYDTIPSYLYFIKAVQQGNSEAASKALKHVADVRGPQTASELAFLAKRMAGTNINDLARRGVTTDADPQMRKLYSMINENPDLINKFEYVMPSSGGMATSLVGR
jgi:hypothetical protein